MDIETYSPKTATFGTNHWLSRFHHPGTHRNGKQANPPRPLMKKTPKMTHDVGQIVREYVLHGKAGSMMGML
jgi:phage gpG-like protein